MIHRYRDGVVPDSELARGARGGTRGSDRSGAVSHRPGRAHRCARRDPRGSSASTATSRTSSPGSWPRRTAGGAPRPGVVRAGRGTARGLGAAPPVHARLGGAPARALDREDLARAGGLGSGPGGATLGELGSPIPGSRRRRRRLDPGPAGAASRGRHPLSSRRLRAARWRAHRPGRPGRGQPPRHGWARTRLDRAGPRGDAPTPRWPRS